MFEYSANLLRLVRGDAQLAPRVVIFYVSGQCNLNCAYCEDFGARRNAHTDAPVSLENARRILRVIRTGTDALILTGGEPLLHPQIDGIISVAKHELKFREVSIITNATLLDRHEKSLPALDRIIVSLDSLDAQLWSGVIQMPLATVQTIHDNVRRYAAMQKQYGYTMILNAVLNAQTIPGAFALLDFCAQHNLLVSFSPQAVNNLPHYDLMVSQEYKALVQELIARKKRGAPIVGSVRYLETMRDLAPYDCYPLLAPRVAPDGGLAYPCRPLEKANNGQGGRTANLLQIENWAQAYAQSESAYGIPPRACASCFQQCYAEPSLMQTHPFAFLWETARYRASRRGHLDTYAPG